MIITTGSKATERGGMNTSISMGTSSAIIIIIIGCLRYIMTCNPSYGWNLARVEVSMIGPPLLLVGLN